jgi:hypothetical protein
MDVMTAPQDRDPQPDRDDDDVFRQIVAEYGREPEDVVPRWPVSEDLGPDLDDDLAPEEVERAAHRPVPEEPLPGWLEPEALPDEGHFEPPPPPRLPRPRLRTTAALILLVLGFAVLFVPFRVGLDDSTPSLLLGMLLVAGGAALLLAGMRDAPGSDDRPDDGAVV